MGKIVVSASYLLVTRSVFGRGLGCVAAPVPGQLGVYCTPTCSESKTAELRWYLHKVAHFYVSVCIPSILVT